MKNGWLVPILGGVIVGLGLSAYARSGNGFLVGPGMLFFLVLLVGVAVVGVWLLSTGPRVVLGRQLLAFVATAIAVLVLLAVTWPYPPLEGPVPFEP
jgi:hypothetical protein